MPPRSPQDRYQAPLMLVFAKPHQGKHERQPGRVNQRERGASEPDRLTAPGRTATRQDILRSFVAGLDALVNTVDLASCVDLSDHPRTAASILNYGLADITRLSAEPGALDELAVSLRRALLRHEPRLIADSLVVAASHSANPADAGGYEDVSRRLRLDVSGEIAFMPQPIAVAFHADLDVTAGRVRIDAPALSP
ncbi:type VI secretion system baseplate subunit TssE [Jiella mangrovi]|uniref:GPW/gp25 family protein n=1 Tax=Jiella mangrovi TaxID=2821407 RepID=A0ABS4BJ04_9HYPH|nr:GPW/gp25 family protein [Jiella mangrovi]MBP0615935.1 GPW/gp25 family protein [Jiella mangrovi]